MRSTEAGSAKSTAAIPAQVGQTETARFWPVWLVAFGAALALYAATVAPDVLMMDYGEYQRSTWMFPHVEPPQGSDSLVRVHVNYLMAVKFFGSLVPVGPWVMRVNLFSGLAGAIAVGNACVLAFALTRSKAAVGVTWLALALGEVSWLYSVIAHVASLQAAAMSAEILFLYFWTRSGNSRWLLALWAVNGFAAGVHMQNGLATPVYLVILLLAWRQGRIRRTHVALCWAVWLVAFSPYLVYCLHQWMARDPGGSAIASMTVGRWGGQMWQIKPRIWMRGLLAIALNYPTGLALLYIPGVLALGRQGLSGALRWGWLAALAINLLFSAMYNIPDQQRYFTMVFAAAAPLIGLGAVCVLRSRSAWTAAYTVGLLVVPIYAFLPVIVRQPSIARRLALPAANVLPHRDPYEFYLRPWKTGWHNDRQYLEEILADLPAEAMFFCNSTIYDGLRTLQVVESQRRDVMPDPSLAELGRNIDRPGHAATAWRKPVYTWAPLGSGVPSALARHCRFIVRGQVWEVLPPEERDAFLRDLSGNSG
jgi:hypothetical protein